MLYILITRVIKKIKKSLKFLIVFIFLFGLFSFYREKLNIEDNFIQYECNENDICGGWADRLKGIMSTFAFSLITKRKFLIKMNKNCDLKNVLEPNEVNWNHELISLEGVKSKKTLKYAWNYNLNKKFKSEKKILSNYTNQKLLIIKSGFMFSDSLSENPNLKETIEKLGYSQSSFKIAYLFREWYKKLFKLNSRLQKKLDSFMKKIRPYPNSKIICAQVRIGDPGHIGLTDSNASTSFWYFINETFLQTNLSNRFSIYITSDREYVKEEGKKFFAGQNVFYIQNSSSHVEVKSKDNGCKNFENVIFDFHLMQYCDIGVVSHSGFGILSMWNRPEPFKDLYVYTKNDQLKFRNAYWNRKNLTFVKYSNLSDIYFI